MRWEDEGIVLQVRPHSESGRIIEVLTSQHGLTRGYVRGGQRRQLANSLQSGLRANVVWNARLADHLGQFQVDPGHSIWPKLRDDRDAMAALASMFALLSAFLPEREPCNNLYDATLATIATLDQTKVWPTAYAHWELGLLRTLGYGLQLEQCAATGARTDLAFVSPRTGRAVGSVPGEPYRNKLLALPGFLTRGDRASTAELQDALTLTGYFLERKVAHVTNRSVPAARARLQERLQLWLEDS